MNGHRRFLITLGLVQLAFACGYLALEPARGVSLEQRASFGAAYEILEELEDRGALREPTDFDEKMDREVLIIEAVRERLVHSRKSRRFLIGVIASFGFLSLVAGLIPERHRPRPPAEG